ncbi:MAG TPA: T9SS type A sorting domain-containing protein [Ignavibacteriaceae bacterium]|nr:T9SS type A sorting domain-containing protein [Ignavibacteriaceae bacterium]
MKSIKLMLFLSILSLASYQIHSQSFQISHVPAEYYSLDKFTYDIYYAEIGYWNLFVKNLKDSSVKPCPFPTLPVFANKSHKCVYGNEDSVFVYDFETKEKINVGQVVGNTGPMNYIFSPNDEYVLFKNLFYSFADSSLHPMDFIPDPSWMIEWIDETSFILGLDDDHLYKFDFLSNTWDPVLSAAPGHYFAAYAYNRKNHLLYYSYDESILPKIHSFDFTTHIDSIVIDTENDTNDNCWWTYNWFREMDWSPDSARMAFVSDVLDAGGTIYTYSPADKRLYKYTNCGGEGYEYHLTWLNNDTIVYFNASWGFIYGFALDDPLAVEENKSEVIPSIFEITAYPNPFNGVIHFNLSGGIKEPVLSIYNINGEEVARIDKLDGSGPGYSADWNGKNYYGAEVSSGVYFVIIRDKQNPLLIKGIAKVILLK